MADTALFWDIERLTELDKIRLEFTKSVWEKLPWNIRFMARWMRYDHLIVARLPSSHREAVVIAAAHRQRNDGA